MGAWLTVEQAAEIVQVTPRMILDRVRSGEIPVARIGKTVRIDPSDFEDWLDGCKSNMRGKRIGSESRRTPDTTISKPARRGALSASQRAAMTRERRGAI